MAYSVIDLRTIYIVNTKQPYRKIRVVRCALFVKKWAWAEDHGARRYLIGASAFFTREAAVRSKVSRLTKITSDKKRAFWAPYSYGQSVIEITKKPEDM